jgi:site-specific DNA-methyltransferase (adenine-specific)
MNIQLYNGDCLEEMKKIEHESVDMVLTDPPYGTTACKWDTVIDLDKMWEQLKRIIKPNGAIVMTASQPFTTTLISSNMKIFKYCWVWEKNLKTGNLNARRMPMGGHEDVVVFCKKSPTYNPQKRQRTTELPSGNKKNSKTTVYGSQQEYYINNQSDKISPDTVIKGIKCVHNSSGKLHPTQKPVALMEYLIKTYTNENETVVDFTMGSGTTGVACVNTNRNFIGIELDEEYFKIAQERIQKAQKEKSRENLFNYIFEEI